MKEIKKQFMAYRNGVVADTLRRAFMQQGECPYHIIFGLNLPQLSEIARSVPDERRPELASALWADRKVRESRLLACYLGDPATLSVSDAMEMVSDLQTAEEADILCLKILSRHPQRPEIQKALDSTPTPLAQRCLQRLTNT